MDDDERNEVKRKEKNYLENIESKKYWIWFSLIKNLGSRRKLKLLELYKNPEKIYFLTKEELLKIEGIREETVKNIAELRNAERLEVYGGLGTRR